MATTASKPIAMHGPRPATQPRAASAIPSSVDPTHAYFPHVDGLRALAVIAVILYHLNSTWLPAGFVGVDVFFAISGFVVTASLARGRRLSFPTYVTGFYSRRLLRIVPALLLVLLVTTALYVFVVPRAWLSSTTDNVAEA